MRSTENAVLARRSSYRGQFVGSLNSQRVEHSYRTISHSPLPSWKRCAERPRRSVVVPLRRSSPSRIATNSELLGLASSFLTTTVAHGAAGAQ